MTFSKFKQETGLGYSYFSLFLLAVSNDIKTLGLIDQDDIDMLSELRKRGYLGLVEVSGKPHWKPLIAADQVTEIEASFNKHRLTLVKGRNIKFSKAATKRVEKLLSEGKTVEDFERVHAYTANEVRAGRYESRWFVPETLYKVGQSGYSFDSRLMLAETTDTTVNDNMYNLV